MFEGVYCKEKNSDTVHESILIDSFDNCINSALNSHASAESPSDSTSVAESPSDSTSVEMSSTSNHIPNSETRPNDPSVPLSTCIAGENVRAKYTEDGKLYEAVVKKLFGKPPNIMAHVRYHGYGNEESVPMNSVFPSLGPAAIEKQIKSAASDVGVQTGSYGSVKRKMFWKKGMACRAYYDQRDLIYEATVLDVNVPERSAYVEMLGYGTCFHVKFENMYESIPALREKQVHSARKFAEEMQQKNLSAGLLMACNKTCPMENESNNADFKKNSNVTAEVSKKPKLEIVKEEVESSESQISEVLSKENESNCSDLETEVGVTPEIPKEPKPKCTNEKEQNSETRALVELVLKENKSSSLDVASKVDIPASASQEPKLESIHEKVQSSETLASHGIHLEKDEADGTDFEVERKLRNTPSESTDVLMEGHLPLSLRNEDIMQPESESEALACLLSANYLSGYYAGYYDCIRKRQNSDKI